LTRQTGTAGNDDELFLETLRTVAPGTPLRDALDDIVRARTGALLVVSDAPAVRQLCSGGFYVDCEFTPSNLYELAKLDGAIIMDSEARRIVNANVQLTPDTAIPSTESGIRHRSAERTARQTGALVIAVSERRNMISVYRGHLKHVLRDMPFILSKANQTLQAIERYRAVFDEALATLTALELDYAVTLDDVGTTLRWAAMIGRLRREVQRYIVELGSEGRLVQAQLHELSHGVDREAGLVVADYRRRPAKDGKLKEGGPADGEVERLVAQGAFKDHFVEIRDICRQLGYSDGLDLLDTAVSPRGYRLLSKVPRLPFAVARRVVERFEGLEGICHAAPEELDDIEGIGRARAHTIREWLKELRQRAANDRRHSAPQPGG